MNLFLWARYTDGYIHGTCYLEKAALALEQNDTYSMSSIRFDLPLSQSKTRWDDNHARRNMNLNTSHALEQQKAN